MKEHAAGNRFSAALRRLLTSVQVWSQPHSQAPTDGRLAFDRIEQARVFAAVAQRLGSAADSTVTVGRYRVQRKIGEGGMGIVYLADDPELDRPIVIKVLRPSMGRGSDPLILREARAVAALDHPNVVKVFDLGRFDPRGLMQLWQSSDEQTDERSRVFLAMEYVPGGTLADWLQGHRSLREVLSAFIQAGSGLAAAHARGVVHRDFKPENVLVGSATNRKGVPLRVRVADFGLARAAKRAQLATTIPERLAGSLTREAAEPSGAVGTPRYMAPEQMRGDPVGPRADQYAFCVALLEALGSDYPFAQSGWGQLYQAKLEGAYSIPEDVPASIEAAIRRGLEADPAARFPSMPALLRRLKLQRAKQSKTLLVVAGLVSVVGFGAAAAPDVPDNACRLAQVEAGDVWTDEAKDRTRAAFSRGHPAVAQDGLSTFDDNLGAFVRAWDEAAATACREQAPTVETRCLQQQLRVVDQLVRQTSRVAGKPQIVHAVEASADLPSPSACGSTAETPATKHSPASERLLAEIDAAMLLDDRAVIVDRATEAVTLARDSGDDHLLAEALLRLGSTRMKEERATAATPVLVESFQIAASLRWDEAGADAALALMHLHNRVGDRREAQVWEREATVLVARLEPPSLRAAQLQWYRGVGALRSGEFIDAESALREALSLYEQTEDVELAEITARADLAIVLSGLDRVEEAHTEAVRAVELGTRHLGTQHPTVAKLIAAQASDKYYAHPDRAEQGRALLAQALTILERNYGSEHILVADTVSQLAFAAAASGHSEVAVEHYRRALGTYATIGSEAADSEAAAALGLAGALTNLERYAAAAQAARRALDICIARMGADSLQAAYADGALARALLGESRLDAAKKHAERSLASFEARLGPEHADTGILLRTLGRIHAARGDSIQARTALERALAIFEDAFTDSQYVEDVRAELQALRLPE